MRDEPSDESQVPEAAEIAIPDERPQENTEEAGIPVIKIVDGGISADKDSDSEDNMPISFCVKRRVEEPSASIPRSKQAKILKEVTTETLVRMGLAEEDDSANAIPVDETLSPAEPAKQNQKDKMAESEKRRKAEEDLSAIKVYKKQKSRRNLSLAMDTQEPGTQSVSDIQSSPALDTQEPGTQSVSDIHEAENVESVAAAQGTNPDKTTNTDEEEAIPDTTAIPDEGANPDEGVTPDGNTNPEEATIPDASTAVPEATQEPFTQSVKESQAPQEPPAQRVGESLNEAESGKFSNLLSFISRIICKNEH